VNSSKGKSKKRKADKQKTGYKNEERKTSPLKKA